ncbi:MAG: molybdopterin-binding protein [Methanomassiliicoccales archaeon]|jgi:nicotinamide-nucleotide amidase
MRIELLVIGDELLTGRTDPYPAAIIGEIKKRGAYVSRLTVITDDLDIIVSELEASKLRGTELNIVTGGLGPTIDDVTRHAVAKFFGVDLVVDGEAERWLGEAIQRMHGRRPKPNAEALLMARVPRGTKALSNPVGAACGIEATSGTMRIVCLPGFPKEMATMFDLHVLPLIVPEASVEREFRVKLRETTLEPIFQTLAKEYGVRIASLPKEDWRSTGNVVVIKGESEKVDAASKRFLEIVADKKDEYLE